MEIQNKKRSLSGRLRLIDNLEDAINLMLEPIPDNLINSQSQSETVELAL